MLVAKEFTKNDEIQLMNMVKEIISFDNDFEGLNNISDIENYNEFLDKLEKNKYQELINLEYSPQTTYGVFENNKLIGGFNLRHILKGNLINYGGNIGYLIRPSERGKKYGNKILYLALKKAQELGLTKVLISCKKENIASMKVIENNGGIYDGDYYDEVSKETFKRYWINISKKTKNG